MPELPKGTKQSPSIKARALRLLSLREFSRKDLKNKLLEAVNTQIKINKSKGLIHPDIEQETKSKETEIEVVLDDFEARGWLSDLRFAEALVRSRSPRYGLRKIQNELQKSGVDLEKTGKLLRELKETEYVRAHTLWLKKFGVIGANQKEKGRQYRFLVSKGFGSDSVSKIIEGSRTRGITE